MALAGQLNQALEIPILDQIKSNQIDLNMARAGQLNRALEIPILDQIKSNQIDMNMARAGQPFCKPQNPGKWIKSSEIE